MEQSFLDIIDWLYSKNATFGVNHVVIGGKVYWLDNDSDRNTLHELWEDETWGT